MAEECEHLSKCGFFKNFKANPEVVQKGWIRMYCSDFDRSEQCVRKKIRKETGSPPPDNMTPTGVLIGRNT